MQSIDTNVFVRLVVHDDKEQGQRAEAVFRDALRSGGVWISQVVVVEAVWVLRAAYKFDRASIVTVIRKLLNAEGVTVEQEAAVRNALSAFETGEADLADYLILETATRCEALPLWTFDRHPSLAEGAAQVP